MKAILIDRVRVITLAIAAVPRLCLQPFGLSPQETQRVQVNDYRIGPKDLLEITVFELPELNQTVRVSEDGSITLSLLGKVEVAGFTAQELETGWPSSSDQQYTKGAHVTVFIKEYQKVSVIGAVGRPGHVRAGRAHDPSPGHRPGGRTDGPGHERDLSSTGRARTASRRGSSSVSIDLRRRESRDSTSS